MSTVKIIKGTPEDVANLDSDNISRAFGLDERATEVVQRAIDLFDNGQTQPVRCFIGPEGHPHVYIGHTRAAAVALIREGFQVPTGETETVPVEGGEEGQTEERPVYRTIHEPDFPLLYTVDEDLTPEEADVRSVADNFQNNKPNDLDLATAAKVLQDRYSYTDAKVTAILGVSDPFKIGRVKKLLRAPKYIQEAVHEGKLATATAIEALEATGEAKTAANKVIKEGLEKGKAPTQVQVRRAIEGATKTEPVPGSRGTPRRPVPQGSEIREFFKVLSKELEEGVSDEKNPENIPEVYANVISAFNRWTHGEINEKTLLKKLDEYFGVGKKGPAKKTKAQKEADKNDEAVFAEQEKV